MKGRESGMPEEVLWSSFFDADMAMERLWPSPHGDVVELGCGYGTFTFPSARLTAGIVTALDLDADMVAHVRSIAQTLGILNVHALERDFVENDLGVAPGSQSHVMIYNLLHLEDPVSLLRKSHQVLARDGVLSVMHWRSDVPTPRGPPLAIRPTPEDCTGWMHDAGFSKVTRIDLKDCCPFHYGLIAMP
jgi:SAM-dependent methyltransferase